MEEILTSQGLISLLTLTIMEVVLGIDNVIFLSILAGRLPENERESARKTGLIAAMVMRLGLLSIAAWIVQLNDTLFSIASFDFSGKALILLGGGLFLLYKATAEIHAKMEPTHDGTGTSVVKVTFAAVIGQILIMDLVFSLDSVITAVGMTHNLLIMVIANVIALITMLAAAKSISEFVNEHPTVKMLALAFLVLIGTMLVAEAFHVEVPKGYIYFAMGFSAFVEFLNLRMKSKNPPLVVKKPSDN